MSWFSKERDVYHIVEVERNSKLPELTGDLKESLKALANHPGFQYLLMRFRYQKGLLGMTLNEGLQMTETQLRFLQAGIYWASLIEKDIQKLTQDRVLPASHAASNQELEDLARVKANMDLVGA